MKIKNTQILYFLLFLSIISNFILFSKYNYEVLATKQYFSDGFYHGGYVTKIIDFGQKKDLFLLHAEAEMNFFNVYNFISQKKNVQSNFSVYQGTGVDRLYIPFLASIILIAGSGNLDIAQAYFILNIIMWLLSIFLIYHITVLMLKDKTAALIASILLSSYPIFTLLFQSLKVQNAGGVFLLIGIFFHEKYLFNCDLGKRINIGTEIGFEIETAPGEKTKEKFSFRLPFFPQYIEKFIMFTIIFLIGFYFSGGNLYFLLFLAGRYITGIRKGIWKPLVILAVSFILARYLANKLNDKYCLHFVNEVFNLSKIIKDTLIYIIYLPFGMGTGMEQYSFLNYPGFKFFNQMLPLLLKDIVLANPLLWVLSFAAIIIKRGNWKYLFIALLLIGAHLGTFVTGWIFYYGYMSAGTLVMLMIMSAFTVGICLKSSNMILKIIGYLLLLATLGVFMLDTIPGVHMQLDNFYGGYGSHINKKSVIYHYENHNEY